MVGPQPVPRPDWSPLPLDGAVGVDGKVLLPGLPALAILRFARNAGFPAHAAPFEVDIVCLDRAGFVLVGETTYPFHAGQRIRWPAHGLHRLWTESTEMTTLMIERGSWETAAA